MRKIIVLAVTLICIWALVGCGASDKYEVSIGNGEAAPSENLMPESIDNLSETDAETSHLIVGESQEKETDTNISMVMVNGELYYDTGKESTIELRCGVLDGQINSTVDEGEIPTEDNQSNFGTGYGYQYGIENTIEVCIADKWIVFERRCESEEGLEDIYRFTITNGNNGKQLEFSKLSSNTGFLEIMDKYERLELDEAENQTQRVGYSYCLRLYDVDDNLLHTITPYENDIEIDGVYYTARGSGSINELFLAMDALFEEENIPLASTSVLCGKQIDLLDGVTMEVTYATDKGANLVFTNNTDKTIQFGDDYSLQMLKDGEWYLVDKIIEDAAFNDIAYNVPQGGINAWRVKWTYFHGILPKGNYRIVKTVMDFRGTGDYTNYLLAAEFEVE